MHDIETEITTIGYNDASLKTIITNIIINNLVAQKFLSIFKDLA